MSRGDALSPILFGKRQRKRPISDRLSVYRTIERFIAREISAKGSTFFACALLLTPRRGGVHIGIQMQQSP
jgi:hypothetical protein